MCALARRELCGDAIVRLKLAFNKCAFATSLALTFVELVLYLILWQRRTSTRYCWVVRIIAGACNPRLNPESESQPVVRRSQSGQYPRS